MIAAGFVAAGARTYIASRKAAECEATAARLSANGTCIAVPADLSTQQGIAALAGTIRERESRLDILVNNAGATWGAPLETFPEAGWDKVMDINVKGPFFLVQALLPLLQAGASAEDPARIINIGSIDGLNVNRLPTYAYGPSKAAIHHLTRTLAAHLADRFITCNAIAPGPFPSKMMAHTLDTMGEQIRAGVPLKRIGKPSDMAGTAIYLASLAGAYTNGAVIPVDGGIVAAARTL
jgi:NAD(P)-dependent dehydrogenase (short-subunit alcohol dehydrogenase family)